tara:strand:- start:189 stop:305 length:117 start_codon:yes stop_codon:yes gene_type:complete
LLSVAPYVVLSFVQMAIAMEVMEKATTWVIAKLAENQT